MKKNIIITGGELFNKGAQAMTFIAVDELKKRFPNRDIYVLSDMDLRRPEQEKRQFSFYFTGWYPIKYAMAQKNTILRMACLMRNRAQLIECERLYRNCELMVDVSGYGLGSNWGVKQLENYLNHLEFARAFGIPCYLMPQSFGPFDFRGEKKAQGERVPELFSSVKVICAREVEGYEGLRKQYGLKNVVLCTDIVLGNKEINLKNVFRVPPEIRVPHIEKDSVAIIPNVRCVDILEEEQYLSLYKSTIEILLDNDRTVYLLTHATADKELCKKIKSLFPQSDKVIFLDQDFSCLEFNTLVGHFDFLVASRFHSIVYAFKNDIPCIVLGWADKYKELMAEFSQNAYCFDLRDGIDSSSLSSAVQQLCMESKKERSIIQRKEQILMKENAFDYIKI